MANVSGTPPTHIKADFLLHQIMKFCIAVILLLFAFAIQSYLSIARAASSHSVNFINSCPKAIMVWSSAVDLNSGSATKARITLCEGEKTSFIGLGQINQVGYFHAQSAAFGDTTIIWEGSTDISDGSFPMLGRDIKYGGTGEYNIQFRCDKVIDPGANWEVFGRHRFEDGEINYGYHYTTP